MAFNKIQTLRNALQMFALCGFLIAMATPLLNRYSDQWSSNIGFFAFGQRQWKVDEMPEDSKKKCRLSIAAMCVATPMLGLIPFLVPHRLSVAAIIGTITTIIIIALSVTNMMVGVHFYNESPGAFFGGVQHWGTGNSIHMAACGVMFIPIIAFFREVFANRALRKKAIADLGHADFVQEYHCPKYFTTAPLLVALVLTIIGCAGPQASNTRVLQLQPLNISNIEYLHSWHFAIVTEDFTIEAIKAFTCEELWRKLVASTVLLVVAAVFAYVSLNIHMLFPDRAVIAVATSFFGFAFGAASMAITTSMTKPITCGGDQWREQGPMTVGGGLIALYIGLGCNLLTIIIGAVFRKSVVEEGEEQNLLN